MRLEQAALVILLVITVDTAADEFDCQLAQSDSVMLLQLDLLADPARATLQLDDKWLVFSPLERKGTMVLYSELGPGADDERFVTYQMLRLNLETGQLDYFRHVPKFEYLQASCNPR